MSYHSLLLQKYIGYHFTDDMRIDAYVQDICRNAYIDIQRISSFPFSFAAPKISNSLLSELRHTDYIQKFKSALKTHLLGNFYPLYIKFFYLDLSQYI